MNRCLIILCGIVFLSACTLNENPEFQRMENIRVLRANAKNIEVEGEAVFYNPNSVGVTFTASDVDVYANEVKVGKVKTTSFEIPSKENFTVPLLVDIPVAKLMEQEGKLGLLLGALSKREVKLHYKGVIKLDVLGVEVDYDLDHEESITY